MRCSRDAANLLVAQKHIVAITYVANKGDGTNAEARVHPLRKQSGLANPAGITDTATLATIKLGACSHSVKEALETTAIGFLVKINAL